MLDTTYKENVSNRHCYILCDTFKNNTQIAKNNKAIKELTEESIKSN